MTKSQKNVYLSYITSTLGALESLVQMNPNGFPQNKAFAIKDTDMLTKTF